MEERDEDMFVDVCYCGDGCVIDANRTSYCSHCVPTKTCSDCGSTYVDLPEKYVHKCDVITFVGHDHFKYVIRKGYTGSNFIYITRSPGDALPGSMRIKSITVHIDEVSALISALKEMQDKT